MKQTEIDTTRSDESQPAAEYEAPAIEIVVTREDLEREVHYAGFATA